MNPETIQLIEKFAAKLGTTSEHLWAVLVKQAYVAAVTDILCLAVASVGIFFVVKFWKRRDAWARAHYPAKQKAEFEKDKAEYPSLYKDRIFTPKPYESDPSDFVHLIIAGVIAGILFLFSLVATLIEVPTALINPEAYAIEKIGKVLHGSSR